MKRIIMTMMAMVMMMTFGSVTINAAKRDEIEVYDIITHDEDWHPIGDDGKEKTAVLDKLTLELDDDRKYPTVSGRRIIQAYARWKGIEKVGFFNTLTSKLTLVEDSETGHDIAWRFNYVIRDNGKWITKTVEIPTSDLRWSANLTEIYKCL